MEDISGGASGGVYDDRGEALHGTQGTGVFLEQLFRGKDRMVYSCQSGGAGQSWTELDRGDSWQPGGNFLDQRISIGICIASGQGPMCTECDDEAVVRAR